jgi:hypothetical protein
VPPPVTLTGVPGISVDDAVIGAVVVAELPPQAAMTVIIISAAAPADAIAKRFIFSSNMTFSMDKIIASITVEYSHILQSGQFFYHL